MKLICNICKYDIATVDPLIKLPIQGSMFTSKDPKHNFPPPWSPVVTFLHMYCPMCDKRPFITLPLGEVSSIEMIIRDDSGHPDYIAAVNEYGISGRPLTDEQLEAIDLEHKLHDEQLKLDAEANRKLYLESQSDKDVKAALPESSEPEATEVATPAPENEGGTTETAGEAVGAPSQPATVEPNEAFELMLKSGEVIQRGSWYEYKGENHRKDDIIRMLSA